MKKPRKFSIYNNRSLVIIIILTMINPYYVLAQNIPIHSISGEIERTALGYCINDYDNSCAREIDFDGNHQKDYELALYNEGLDSYCILFKNTGKETYQIMGVRPCGLFFSEELKLSTSVITTVPGRFYIRYYTPDSMLNLVAEEEISFSDEPIRSYCNYVKGKCSTSENNGFADYISREEAILRMHTIMGEYSPFNQ